MWYCAVTKVCMWNPRSRLSSAFRILAYDLPSYMNLIDSLVCSLGSAPGTREVCFVSLEFSLIFSINSNLIISVVLLEVNDWGVSHGNSSDWHWVYSGPNQLVVVVVCRLWLWKSLLKCLMEIKSAVTVTVTHTQVPNKLISVMYGSITGWRIWTSQLLVRAYECMNQ